MKRVRSVFAVVAAALILMAAVASAAPLITEWSSEVFLEERSSVWTVVVKYNESITKSDYFVLGKIGSLEVVADELPVKCEITEKLGTSIICNNINARKITYRFHLLEPPEVIQELKVFRYRLSITQLTDKFSMVVKLPLGAALAEKLRLEGTGLQRFEPGWGREGTDGRYIFVEWVVQGPHLGDTYDFSLVYEKFTPESTFPYATVVGLLLMILAIGAIVLYQRRTGMHDVLPVLTEGERKVVEILLREKKEIDQRVVVRELDYSKSKVSRIVKNLIERGLVEKTPKGRTNLLRLKKPSRMAEKDEKSS